MKVTARDNNARVGTMCRHLSVKFLCRITSCIEVSCQQSYCRPGEPMHRDIMDAAGVGVVVSHIRILVQPKIKHGHPFCGLWSRQALSPLTCISSRKENAPRGWRRQRRSLRRDELGEALHPQSLLLVWWLWVSFTAKSQPPV